MNKTIPPKLATYLAHRWADWAQSENRTKDQAVAAARLNGACEAAHALGYGSTPASVSVTVQSAYRAPGDDQTRSQWIESIAAEITTNPLI